MNAIRIRKQIDSETLYLPELKPLIGKQVDIIVLDESSAALQQGAPDKAAEEMGVWELAAQIVQQIPKEDAARVPSDGAEQHDHYIYGTAKKGS